ncbi:aminoglycoside phosphotransferase family protein [Gorillibacterium timonense]|uniref:aminoglycoside phosphotransferase family protein n=1 Tax=Gorillibacterium timonense TaxID=1689269 RepID=UPI00071C8E1D|nr:phosphotransferase [Gorillibacterium timonense]
MSTGKVYESIIKKEPITKGWSEDQKYCVTTISGVKYLLRISPASQYEAKKMLFSIMEQIAALGIPMCLPIEFGTCDDGVYSIQSWIDGVDLETVLPLSSETLLSETEQYALGLQSGKIAKKIHTIPLEEPHEEWAVSFNREIDRIVRDYHTCGLHVDGDAPILAYVESSRHLLKNRPQCFLAGDYHVLNMMYENGGLVIIDFERYRIGDPWNEFNGIVWSAMASPHFATGQLHGYFDGEPPMEFFKLLALYIVILVLSLLSSWAVTSDFGRTVTLKLSQDVLKWFDNMQSPIPTWYLKDY